MKLRGDQLHCPAFDSLSGQILTGQESRGEISKTRLTLLLTVLKAEGGPPKRGWEIGSRRSLVLQGDRCHHTLLRQIRSSRDVRFIACLRGQAVVISALVEA